MIQLLNSRGRWRLCIASALWQGHVSCNKQMRWCGVLPGRTVMLLTARPTWARLMVALRADNLWPLPAECHFPVDLSTWINKKTKVWMVSSIQDSWKDRCSQKQNEEMSAWFALFCFHADYMFDMPFPVLNFQSNLLLSLCFKFAHTFTFSSCRSKNWNGDWNITDSSQVPINHKKLSLDNTCLSKIYVQVLFLI